MKLTTFNLAWLRLLTIGWFLFAFTAPYRGWAEAPPLVLQHLTTRDGLPQGTVLATLQDSQGFMWFGTEDGLVRYDGHEFVRYGYSRSTPDGLPGNYVQALAEDREHNIWIAVNDGGLVRWNRTTDRFSVYRHDPKNTASLSSNMVCAILIDDRDRIWIGTRDAGIDILDPRSGAIEHRQKDQRQPSSLIDDRIRVFARGKGGAIWIGTDAGLDRTEDQGRSFLHTALLKATGSSAGAGQVSQVVEDPDGSVWVGTAGGGLTRIGLDGRVNRIYRSDPTREISLPDDDIRAIAIDHAGRLWVGTIQGLGLYDRLSDSFTTYRHDDREISSLRDSYVLSLYEDKSGLLWIGTREGGVSRWNPHSWELGMRRPNWLSGKPVTAFAQASNQRVWIASLDGGLVQFDPKTGESIHIDQLAKPAGAIVNRNVMALLTDAHDALWVGLMDQGLRRIRASGQVDSITAKRGDPRSLSAPGVMTIFQARDGRLWIGTYGGGANIIDPVSGRVLQLPFDSTVPGAISGANVTAFAEDTSGNVWIGTQGGGLDLARADGTVLKVFQHDPQDPLSLPANTVYAITIDTAGRVWVGTEGGGLAQVKGSYSQPDSIHFDTLSRTEGLSSDTIYGILPDAAGNLWLSGNAGLMRLDPQSGAIKTLHVEQGLQGEEFDYGAARRLSDGRLAFGGPGGFNIFDPASLTLDNRTPPLVLTRVEVLGVPLTTSEPYWLLHHVDLDANASIVSFDFSALDFASTQHNRLAYRITGFTKDWINLDTQRRVTLTNLDSGDYTVEVRAANSESTWGDAVRLGIHKRPAAWKSHGAIAAYITALIGLVVLLSWRQQHKWRQAIDAKRHLEHEVALRTKELSESTQRLKIAAEARSAFLARMTHELRTPMNGVVGMTELLERTPLEDTQRRLTRTIRSSANVLLTIINDLLDLSKSHAGKIELEAAPLDLCAIIEESAALLEGAAANKGLDLTVIPPSDPRIPLVGDSMRIRQILVNLIGNAIKFSERGDIIIKADVSAAGLSNACVELTVSDSGIGISPAAIERIFEPFTQAEESITRRFGGTGLGLAICRELALVMGGSISVESHPGVGSKFRVILNLALLEDRSALAPQPLLKGRVRILTKRAPLAEALRRHTASMGLVEAEPVEAAFSPRQFEHETLIVDATTYPDYWQAARNPLSSGGPKIVMIADPADMRAVELRSFNNTTQVVDRPIRKAELYRALERVYGASTAQAPDTTSPVASLDEIVGHVLIVDDEPVNAAVAQGYLEALGCTSVAVDAGAVAVARCASEQFDLILMDVSMPVMDGFAATTLIRHQEIGRKRVPIVALTAHHAPDYQARCRAAGMDGVLQKPYTIVGLQTALQQWLLRPLRSVSITHAQALRAQHSGIDPAVIARLRKLPARGGPDLLARLVPLFKGSASADVDRLKAALDHADWDGAATVCHKFKASAYNVGATAFAQALDELETSCKRRDAATSSQLWAAVLVAYPRLLDELERVSFQESA